MIKLIIPGLIDWQYFYDHIIRIVSGTRMLINIFTLIRACFSYENHLLTQ